MRFDPLTMTSAAHLRTKSMVRPDARTMRTELLASWREYGPKALETIARERRVDYVKLVVSLLKSDAEPGPSRLDSTLLPDLPGGRHGASGLLDE